MSHARSARAAPVTVAALVLALSAELALAQPLPLVIYSEVPGSPSAVVPGALDATGTPVLAEFTVISDLHVSPDGSQWILKATTSQPDTERNVMLLGAGDSGTVFAQEGQPVGGGAPGEVYDFFDGVAGFNTLNQFAFSARARDGVPGTLEKVIFFDGTDYTIRVQHGDPALGLEDIPANPTGDETFGNSLNSVHCLDNGTIGFVGATLDNISSFRRPAIFYDDTAFLQSGVDMIAGEVWDSFDSNDFRTTPDGLHYVTQGDTENANTDVDDILVYDGTVVVREGDMLGGMVVDGVFHTKLAPDGSYIARGDDPTNADWVLVDGTVYAQTGDPITPLASETWGDVIVLATHTPSGDIMMAGSTNNVDPLLNDVLVIGDEVVLRESDPVDLDQNGIADDDAFIRIFQADDAVLTPSGELYLLVGLRNAADDNLGDAFIRVQLSTTPVVTFVRGDANGDGGFDIADAIFELDLLFGAGGTVTCEDSTDVNDDGGFDISDPIFGLATLFSMGPNPPEPFPACGTDPTDDPLGCDSFPACP